ncbi:structural protein [Cellulophaga phage phi39:1]|uniref:structural protein n=1 Tax=Cellulophaga phage phi39:1 TaxID=1327993 RepID=UPI000351A836|nr:structural protein [Cellulophaga phage phi39:1]AGO49133.1 structural protein [Cellulophaga phage phi39:1]
MAGEKNISGNLRLKLDGKVIFDATGCNLDFTREITSRAGTKDSAAGNSTKSTKTWSASYSGLGVYTSGGTGAAGHEFKDLVDLWNDDTEDNVVVEFVPSESDYKFYYKGEGIVTSLSGVFNFSEDSTISITVTGVGEILPVDKDVTPPTS